MISRKELEIEIKKGYKEKVINKKQIVKRGLMIVSGNWKMNMSYSSAVKFLSQFNQLINKDEDLENFIFFPPASLSFLFQKEKFYWGGQNVHHKVKGAFTGETSAEVLKTMGASFCLLGHSERRYTFGETDSDIERKFHLLQELGLIPVLCVGESLADRFQKEKALRIQLSWIKNYEKYQNLPWKPEQRPELFKKIPLIVAYEPLWSIGTGDVPPLSEIEETSRFIKDFLQLQDLKVFYGGSVNQESAQSFATSQLIDGLLVGSASLEAEKLYRIYQEVNPKNR